MTALVIGEVERARIAALIKGANENPVDVRALLRRIETAEGKRSHMDQMSRQTIALPVAWLVTFSIEFGHPAGTCRHMSVSVQREGRVPGPDAVWMIAESFGFVGGLQACKVWPEALRGHGKAVNVVQPIPS